MEEKHHPIGGFLSRFKVCVCVCVCVYVCVCVCVYMYVCVCGVVVVAAVWCVVVVSNRWFISTDPLILSKETLVEG